MSSVSLGWGGGAVKNKTYGAGGMGESLYFLLSYAVTLKCSKRSRLF